MTHLALAALLVSTAPVPLLPCVEPGTPLTARAATHAPTAEHRTAPFDAGRAGAHAVDDALRALYERGTTFEDFHANATRRRELWDANYAAATIPVPLLDRGRAVGGSWHLLAVAVDACSDSVNTIPYLALLAERVPGLELRIVDSDVGRAVMEARRTPDGRAATPTVVLLDADFDDAGCFIERPKDLQAWLAENEGRLDSDALHQGKMGWYADDAGASTVEEVVSLMEAAAAGRPRCDAS